MAPLRPALAGSATLPSVERASEVSIGAFMELLPVPGEVESGGTLLGSEFGVVGGAVPFAGLVSDGTEDGVDPPCVSTGVSERRSELPHAMKIKAAPASVGNWRRCMRFSS